MYRIFLSPILIIIIMLLTASVEKTLLYLPLVFALSISLVNPSKIKIMKSLGIFLSVIQSYAVFLGLAIVTYFFDEWLENVTIGDAGFKGIILVTFGGYLSALLLFYFSTFIFNVSNKRFSYMVITVCYAFVVITMQVFSKNEFLQFGVEKFTSYLISWCIFMSLAYSLALNRDEFMTFAEKRKARI
jgi:hypothetical protein